LFPKKIVKTHLLALSQLQEVLGQLHDIAVAADRLTVATSVDNATIDGSRAWAAGLVAGWHTGRIPGLLSQVEGLWEGYCNAERYWKS
jgi:CHAD domain-containing protein